MNQTSTQIRAEGLFRNHDGLLRTSDALELGIHPSTLYAMRDRGDLEEVTRGVYRLKAARELARPDLVAVAVRAPRAVVCLISALAFHDLTTEIPHEVHIALPRDTKAPRWEYPPLCAYHFSGPAFQEGVEQVQVDGQLVKIYSPAKTVVDCFRFRNKIGLSVALEGLKAYLSKHGHDLRELLRYARMLRVHEVMQPYLQALV